MDDRKTVMSWLEGLAQDDWAEWHSDSEVQTTAQAALDLLKEQPEIVRCKNCEYYRGGVLSGYCDLWFRQTGGEETYCSEGRQAVK